VFILLVNGQITYFSAVTFSNSDLPNCPLCDKQSGRVRVEVVTAFALMFPYYRLYPTNDLVTHKAIKILRKIGKDSRQKHRK
jgi:hypothetical protein